MVECNESVRVKAADIVDWGFTQANTIPPLKSQIYKLDKELKRAKAEISELNGVVESNSAEIEGLKEDLAVNIAGYDAEKAEKEEMKSKLPSILLICIFLTERQAKDYPRVLRDKTVRQH